MKAMIMAAGRGTRLRPVTESIPKALVPVRGVTMLEITIRSLMRAGVDEIIVNVHHLAEQILRFLREKENFGIRIEVSDERDALLDTGGGLKKASWFFDDNKPFFIHNADVLSGTDLQLLYNAHAQHQGIATLLVRHRKGNRQLLIENNNRLCGWINTSTGEKIMCYEPAHSYFPIAFSSIHVVDPLVFKLIRQSGAFSIRDLYLQIAGAHPVYAYVDDDSPWIDVGTPQNLKRAADVARQLGI
jgi:NDP-sugar pyrophosphorylase family protein